MEPRRILILAALLGGIFLPSVLFAAADSPAQEAGEKALVADGSVVHDVGALQNNVTNWGLIGSWPSATTPFSHAPSARWGGRDYLFAASLWVGGTVLGEALVTTGQYAAEFRSTEAPGDTIFPTAHGAPGGNRYPWPNPDDDGDGAEDEDPLDGLDNDGDGLVDEDFAAAGHQSYRCAMADNLAEIMQIYPDHTPMNLRIVQETYQWGGPLTEDFIGYEYRITNEGVTAIEDVHCGVFADFDVGAQASDDLVGSVKTLMVQASDGTFFPVTMIWTKDAASVNPAPGLAGFVLCVVESDADRFAPSAAPHSMNIFRGNDSFENGGDPTNDAERYELLSTPGRDPDPPVSAAYDYRFLISGEGIPVLAPEETVTIRFALVLGEDEDDLLGNAAEAVNTAFGVYFDRDGDPANGDEFHVPWLRGEDVPVPAVGGKLQALPHGSGVSLAFDVRNLVGAGAVIGRRAGEGIPARTWPVDVAAGAIVDDDAVGWPRTYDLKVKREGSGDLVLDTVVVERPPLVPARVVAYPNPFNPRLTIAYSLPEAGHARLEVLDVQGRVVEVLFDESRSAGDGSTVWNGLDSRGREVASGVYMVRLVSTRETVLQRVTLLR